MTYRVVQWGTGAVGVEAIRGILDHPDLELVGVKVYSETKVGTDAGALAGRDPIGVTATIDVDTADVDAVLYAPRHPSVDDAVAILTSGANLITTAFAFHPARMEPADRDRLQQACAHGNSSLHGTGLNPGNLGVVVPLALTGLSRTIEHVRVQERADWSVYDSTEITFDQMHFGSPLDQVTAQTDGLRFTSELFQQQVWLLGDALGLGVDEVTTELEVIPASADRDVCGRILRAGTVAGQHWQWTGRRGGQPVVEVETLWTVGEPQPKHWPTPQHGWTVTIEGTPSMRAHLMTLASFRRDVPLEEHVRSASVATAMQAVNAIGAVCDAPAGFVTMADLPLSLYRGGR
ncbi:NAD(P)H-dependent amine dehydrogenase family protein [Mycolicibacterium pallens]|uniref:Dihydrodipicolinate reductase n=1 Tax=Mycolicibacterium pallens TaxID=370524 RepID=A0ABX8VPM0_9MYCO|nr:dihydrodipicolinate reductase [Mycolicibacterium pallens]QYL17404.1 dihydrodipicolinate reductase [Mycolicibacterium pallens]